MASYMTPGVYVEEVPGGPRSIAGVGTSTGAFVGVAPKADAHVDEAIACNNWSQFVKAYVGEQTPSTDLARAVFGFFMNGGTRCYVVNVGAGKPIAGDARKRTGLAALEPIDEVAIVAAPGFHDPASHDALLSVCEGLADRVAILDPPPRVEDTDALKELATLGATSSASEPGEETGAKRGSKKSASGGLRPRVSDGGYGAFYFPWITMRDPLNGSAIVQAAPSGHIAGIYSRVDATRGVHKAPANEVIRGALGVTYAVTRAEQGELNRKGVNCIRVISNAIRVWGARTLAEEASEWRYINVRRLINFIEESIEEGTNWTVFEPNDATLRQSVIRDVSNFLRLQWRAGALVGATPNQAFFVKCDAENNPPEVVDAGRLVVDIGVAPSKPAEFIIFRVAQWAGGGAAEGEEGGGEGAGGGE
jgi:phage tail sheath protein FI